MMTPCPLPIDWLDHVQGHDRVVDAQAHLEACVRCRRVVSDLQAEADEVIDTVLPLWIAPHRFIAWERTEPRAGDICWTVPHHAPPAATDLGSRTDRLMVVLLDVADDAGRSYWSAAPLTTTVEWAHELDLLLPVPATTLQTPLRVHGSLALDLLHEQLDACIGRVVEDAMQLLLADLGGAEPHFARGLPLAGPHDERVAAERWVAELVDRLRLPVEEALSDAEGLVADASSAGLARMYATTLEWRQTSDQHDYALAAATAGSGRLLWVCAQELELTGHLRYESLTATLLLHVASVRADFRERVQVLIEGRFDEDITSEPIELVEGADVAIAADTAVMPSDIERVDVLVVV